MKRSYENKSARSKIVYYKMSKILAILCLITFAISLSGIFNRNETIWFLCTSISIAIGSVVSIITGNKLESRLYYRWDKFNTHKDRV